MEQSKKMATRDLQRKLPTIDVPAAVKAKNPTNAEEMAVAVDEVIMKAYKDGYIAPILKSMKRPGARWLRTQQK